MADDRKSFIDKEVQRVMLPLRKHVEELEPAVANEQLLGLVGRLTARLAAAEYEEHARHLRRASESLDPKQLALALQELEDAGLLDDEDEDEDEVVDDEVEGLIRDGAEQRQADPSQPRRRPRELPKQLPRVPVRTDVPADEQSCPCCGGARVVIGEDVHERLDLQPIRFRVLRFERVRRACECKESGVVTAPAAPGQFERLLASVGLVAFVIASKYDAHLPLYRLQRLCKQMGCAISDDTLRGWVKRGGEELTPLVEAMWTELQASWLVQTDASGITVLDKDAPGGSRLGQMWCYLGDGGRLCVFRYTPDGEGKNGPWKHLARRTGFVQADASPTFDRLFNGLAADAIEVGCVAHARRKLTDLLESDPRVAWPLKRIQLLYRVEKAAAAQGMSPGERLELRRRKSAPTLSKLRTWLLKTAGREPPKSALAKACAYWLNHWAALTRFMEDGRLDIDNTAVEREFRSLALTRKNSLFVGSDRGGREAAVLHSLMRTCRLNDVDPVAYLTDVLGKIADGWAQARIGELLPHRWVQQADEDLKAEAS